MQALLDADIFLYRVGFTTEGLHPGLACARLDSTIDKIINDLETNDYLCVLSTPGKTSFRYELDPAYKGQRVAPKPEHYDTLRDHILQSHPSVESQYGEADDLLGVMGTKDWHLYQSGSVGSDHLPWIVSIDKDLRQIPGNHYHFVKEERYTIDYLSGLRNFWAQVLVGDVADNIPGCPGIGAKKAANALSGVGICEGTDTFFDVVWGLYRAKGLPWGAFTKTADLCWIKKTELDKWEHSLIRNDLA